MNLHRVGRLNVEAAERLGVYDSKRNDIKNGLSVKNRNGDIIQPEQVANDSPCSCPSPKRASAC